MQIIYLLLYLHCIQTSNSHKHDYMKKLNVYVIIDQKFLFYEIKQYSIFLFKDIYFIQTTALKIIMLIILMTHCSKEHILMMLYRIVQGRKVWKRNTIGQSGGDSPLNLKAHIKITKTLMHIIIICIINTKRRGMSCYDFYYCRLWLRYVIQLILT